MYTEGLKGLEKISQAIGHLPDYIQGGGGNTSAKLGNGLMAIKASGYLIGQITENEGFVAVNYQKILDYYRNADRNREVDYDEESKKLAIETITQIRNEPAKRPSVEVGFHSGLKTYVMHSHSVYSNVLCCSEGGSKIISEIMSKTGYDFLILPPIDPGYPLSRDIIDIIDERKARDVNTDVIFLENHGVIVNADDADECIAINKKVNELLRDTVGMGAFPTPKVKQVGDGCESDTPWLRDAFLAMPDLADMLISMPLYPDQLVYLAGAVINEGDAKITFLPKEGRVVYKAAEAEAQAIEETIVGVVYVIRTILEKGKKIRPMPEEGIRYILGWESEKYRRSIVSK